jgi:hypothetical protein
MLEAILELHDLNTMIGVETKRNRLARGKKYDLSTLPLKRAKRNTQIATAPCVIRVSAFRGCPSFLGRLPHGRCNGHLNTRHSS